MRHEIKFRFYPTEFYRFEGFLNKNYISPIYEERLINSIYYDSPNYSAAQSNLSGELNRRKFRLRWYGKSEFPDIASFEIKSKFGRNGLKRNFDLRLNNDNSHKSIIKKIVNSLDESGSMFKLSCDPKSLIRYHRQYFATASGKLRVTLDKNIEFAPQFFSNKINTRKFTRKNPQLVVEFKYDLQYAEEIQGMLTQIPFVSFRNSKYVQSVLE